MKLTEEQENIIASTGDIIINAYAGTGKTSTLIEYAKVRPDKHKTYICFNKSIQIEAKEKFALAGVEKTHISTIHSMAYKAIVPTNNYKVSNSALSSYTLIKLFDLPFAKESFLIAKHISSMFEMFCNSRYTYLDELRYEKYIPEKSARFYLSMKNNINYCVDRLLKLMDNVEIDISHSFYLKKYQLSKPKWKTDIILLDEAQDVNPVILDIVLSQDALKVIVGDTFQSIYGWRGAIDSLQQVSYTQYFLSNSFRFSSQISELAVNALNLKRN